MNTKKAHIVLYGIRVFLMVFWLYVALDKLWDLEAFHRALLRQPLPDWWADGLYWSLPLAELGLSLALIFSAKRWPYLLSALLMLVFMVYIALGVAGLYERLPCGCASVFNGMSWDMHLLVNLALFAISILGWHLSRQASLTDRRNDDGAIPQNKYPLLLIQLCRPRHTIIRSFKRLFPRMFAPFPGKAGRSINLIRVSLQLVEWGHRLIPTADVTKCSRGPTDHPTP